MKILHNLQKMPIWNYSVFHTFVPIENMHEVNTFPVIDYLFRLNKKVIVPKVEESQMLNCEIDKNVAWQKGKFSVPEPGKFHLIDSTEIEVLFIPMLICDQIGHRVGYGGGFYDRFLKDSKPAALKIGLNFFPPVERIDDVQNTDIPLDYCVTGEEIVSFTD